MLVKERRSDKKLSQAAFGKQLDPPVTQGVISAWETGREPIPEARYEQIAKVLDLTVEELQGITCYVSDVSEYDEWSRAILRTERDLRLVVTLQALTMFCDDQHVAGVTIEAIANAVPGLDLEDVRAVWSRVLASPFVERRGVAEWSFRLRFPQAGHLRTPDR